MPGIKAKITVDTKDVKKGLDSTKAQAEQSMSTLGKTLDRSAKGIHGIEDAAKKLLETLGGWGAAAAGGLAVFVAAVGFAFRQFGKFREQAKTMSEGAKKNGMSVEEYSKLDYVARHTGTSVEALTDIIGKLSQAIEKTKQGNEDYLDFWNALGIEMSKINEMTPTEKISAISKAVKRYGDDIKKIPHLEDVFGTQNLKDLESLGHVDVKATVKQAEQFGIVMSDKQVKAMEKWNAVMGDVNQQTMMAVVNTLHFVEAAEKLSKMMAEAQDPSTAGVKAKFGEQIPIDATTWEDVVHEAAKEIAAEDKYRGWNEYAEREQRRRDFGAKNFFDMYKPSAMKQYWEDIKNSTGAELWGMGYGSAEDFYMQQNRAQIEARALANHPEFKDNRAGYIPKEPDKSQQFNVYLSNYLNTILGSILPKRRLVNINAEGRLDNPGGKLIDIAQGQYYNDMLNKMKDLSSKQSELKTVDIAKTIEHIDEIGMDNLKNRKDILEKMAAQLDRELKGNSGMGEETKRLVQEVGGYLRGLSIDSNQMKQLLDDYDKAVTKATREYVKNSIVNITNVLESVKTSKVDIAGVGDVTNIIKEMAGSVGMAVDEWMELQREEMRQQNPARYKGLDKFELEKQLNEEIYESFEDIAAKWAQKMTEQGKLPPVNDLTKMLPELFKRMKDKSEKAIYDLVSKAVENAEREIQRAEDQLDMRRANTASNDLDDAMRELGVTLGQYNSNGEIKKKVDQYANSKQTMREVGLRGDLQGTREDLSYRADVLRRGQKEADRTRAYAEAAKRLGMAAEELPQKFKDEIDNNIDLGFDIDKLAALMGKAAQDNTKVYTNELAKKGGWQESVVVQKDDSWKDRITSIAKLQEKIFNTENAINSKLGD